MSDRQLPFVASSNSTSSLPLAQWQQHQLPTQQIFASIPAAPGFQEAMRQLPLNQQEGVGHPYPVRPGEPDCPYYMRTGLCGFGVNCKFNHPPYSNLVSSGRVPGQFPDRSGQPECQYYLKTGTCKFGLLCKYHHPKEKAGTARGAQLNIFSLPLRLGEKDCAFYLRTGNCKYGATCKFNHPPPLMPVPGSFVFPGAPVHVPQLYSACAPFLSSSRPPFLQAPRFESQPNPPPILTSPAQVPWHPYQVPFLQQGLTGSCVHPALTSSQEYLGAGLTPLTPGSGSVILTSSAPSTPGHLEERHPQRPGQQACSYYMKTGVCKFSWQCKFHHPRDRNTSVSSGHVSSVGLPLRPGVAPCTFFNRFGFCKYGSACKFDHSLMQTAYPLMPSSTATTQMTADGIAAPPSQPILSMLGEDSSGSPSKGKEDATSLSTSIQQLNIQSKHHG
ncbi:hypothetical protein GOP47_0010747 [Adiantum capillus-veneris]|uniref:C3H1-type domain-containing protein n=1 Tax=Adiantum capillus-veneris TaxID=13818 RepID=A0A9D4ZJ09_ADICA|nr:hypothetical protein GOP47_0010747 [Adiantum capillus-veneris]